jgi:hypothetical protein
VPVVARAVEPAERRCQQFAQLRLAGEPDGLIADDGIQRPLGGAVESDHAGVRQVVHFDRHVAEDEDVGVHVAIGHHESVPRSGRPLEAGVAKPARQI